jgi:hypothetical protein
MGLKEIITSANNILDTTNEAVSTANNTLKGVRDHYRSGKKYYNSKKAQVDFAKAEKFNRQSDFVTGLMVVLWLVLIIGTIVLCVTGNDIVLELLHL